MPDEREVAELSYEEAREELTDIVARLESGRADLEDSMRLWQRGEDLAAHCTAILDDAESRLTAGARPDAAPGPDTDA